MAINCRTLYTLFDSKRLIPIILYSFQISSNFDTQYVKDRGTYNVSVRTTVRDSDLQEETVFECILDIPGTDYRLRENILYYPGKYMR